MQGEHKLTFIGAALEVTGSCHLLESNGKRILMDCGMLQGATAAKKIERSKFDFDPGSIDMVVLSHAHLDHSGALPKLVSGGFNGPIYCTVGTCKLLRVLLEDSLHLYLQDLERQNLRRRRAGRSKLERAYSKADVEKVMRLCEPLHYKVQHEIVPGIKLLMLNAGHILGSSIVRLCLSGNKDERILVFSGDLGNTDTTLMPNPETVDQADVVLLESTYGDRNHRPKPDTLAEFEEVLKAAEADEGNVLIPAFAVGRTQELLFHLGCLYQQGKLEGWRVYLDSPMATEVTRIYDECIAALDPNDIKRIHASGNRSLKQFLPCLTISRTVEDSVAINQVESRAIIIAGSGMCTGGRIRHHFKHRIWRRNTHIIFVGFQADGTFGRRLIDGEKNIKLYGQEMKVKAQLHTIGGFSAHAGQDQLVDWVADIKGHSTDRAKVCLIHGEQRAIVELSNQLLARKNIDAHIGVKGCSILF